MRKNRKKLVAMLLTVAMLVMLLPATVFAEGTDVNAMYTDAVNVMKNTVSDEVSSTNAWVIMELARAEALTAEQANAWYTNLENTLRTQNSAKLPADSSSVPNIVTILAVTAIGKDATNVGGYNLLEPLADLNYCTGYVTTTSSALVAIDSKKYTIPTVSAGGTQTTREALIQTILDARNTTGTWGYSNAGTDYADVDAIAMCIQALAPYYNSNADVKSAIDVGISKLSDFQADDGSFNYQSAESAAQVIVALGAMGIHPMTDARFIKNGCTIADGLAIQYVAGQGFKDYTGLVNMGITTVQATYGLVANNRIVNQKSSLYAMTDAVDIIQAASETTTTEASTTTATATTAPTTAAPTTAALDQSPATGDAAPIAVFALIAVASVAGVVAINKKH